MTDITPRRTGDTRGASITGDESQDVRCAISLSAGGRTTWISADVAELVAFALHVRIPIYVDRRGTPEIDCSDPDLEETELPAAFVDAISDILSADTHRDPASHENENRE